MTYLFILKARWSNGISTGSFPVSVSSNLTSANLEKIVQLVEQRSSKPSVEGSSPSFLVFVISITFITSATPISYIIFIARTVTLIILLV